MYLHVYNRKHQHRLRHVCLSKIPYLPRPQLLYPLLPFLLLVAHLKMMKSNLKMMMVCFLFLEGALKKK